MSLGSLVYLAVVITCYLVFMLALGAVWLRQALAEHSLTQDTAKVAAVRPGQPAVGEVRRAA